jgi:hypothetical protein
MIPIALSFASALVLGSEFSPASSPALDSAALFAESTLGPATAPDAAGTDLDLASAEFLDAASLSQGQAPPQVLRRSMFTIKGGYYSTQDTHALDDGYIINASWMDFFSQHFGIETEFGYLEASGHNSGIHTDLWGLPAMLNGRLDFPIGRFDLYGGIGIGSIYYQISSSGISLSHDGWTFAGNGFLGASMNLGDTAVLGLEGKYYLTDSVNVLDGGLDAFALMLTLGFRR